MDKSREKDLEMLNARFNDSTLSMERRNRAWRQFNSILAQVKDKVLSELRHRLIRARAANDDNASDKIEQQIKEHVLRNHY